MPAASRRGTFLDAIREESMQPHPLLMQPILKERVWGGRRLVRYGKHLPPRTPIGESWEIADLPPAVAEDGCSRVAGGPLAGVPLRQVVQLYPDMLLGDALPAADGGFPLLVKLLDAQENLSVQVHPSPEYARRHPEAHLKCEAWVILEAVPGAVLYAGFAPGVDAERARRGIASGAIVDDLVRIPGRPGDCHYLPSGTCHALGAGLLVAEVQTPSDTTFRLYDWGRRGRELHVEEGLACADFGPPLQAGAPARPMAVDGLRTTTLTDTDHFSIERIDALTGSVLPIETDNQPVIWIVTTGRGRAEGGGIEVAMSAGTTILMPAALADGEAALDAGCSLLRVTLPSPTRGLIA